MLPLPSVTVQVTVVVPNGNAAGALLVTEATEQLSLVVGVPSETPEAVQPVLVVTETEVGAVMVGFVLSVTVTVAVHVDELPTRSVTVKVTVLDPVLAHVKVLGETVIVEMPQLSVDPLSI